MTSEIDWTVNGERIVLRVSLTVIIVNNINLGCGLEIKVKLKEESGFIEENTTEFGGSAVIEEISSD
jgi:hypothetical protein